MKTTILILITTVVAAFAVPPSADICVTIAPEDQARVYEAFGSILNLGRPATPDEIQAVTAQWMGQQTQDYERRKNINEFTPPPFSGGSGRLNPPSPSINAPAPNTTLTTPPPKK